MNLFIEVPRTGKLTCYHLGFVISLAHVFIARSAVQHLCPCHSNYRAVNSDSQTRPLEDQGEDPPWKSRIRAEEPAHPGRFSCQPSWLCSAVPGLAAVSAPLCHLPYRGAAPGLHSTTSKWVHMVTRKALCKDGTRRSDVQRHQENVL